MEIAALAVLGGAGFLLAQKTAPTVYPTKPTGGPVVRQKIPVKEPFQGGEQPYVRPVNTVPTSYRAPNPQLDLMYNDLMGKPTPRSEPTPSGHPTYLSGGRLSISHPSVTPTRGDYFPNPTPIATSTPDVLYNAGGVEENPTYVEGDTIVSALSGQRMKSSDFVHNNMQPFAKKFDQNVDPQANQGRLDRYTGSGSTDIRKQEIEQMFDTTNQPFGNVYGMENSSDFIQGRINDPRARNGERPFEPVRVAPGVDEGFSSTGKGGFQQLEVNEVMMRQIRRTDDLRTANNPKLTYKMPVVPGQQFVGKSMENPGEVRKYRPDRFYIDENGERFGAAGQSEHLKETTRPIQIMPHTTRPETSVEYKGPGASQEFGESYVVGSYRKPMGYQFGGAGYRNADGSQYFKQGAADDYGKDSYEIRPNERFFTSERTMGLNLSPAEAGAVTTHFEDDSRPTRRGETIGNIQQAGVATGYASSAPALTVWDPNDIARTTVKEGTIQLDRFGIAAPADGPTRLTVYDPADIAKPTQKAQLSAKSAYVGGPKAAAERFTSHTAAYNMRLNPNKQQIAKGRQLGGGNIQLFRGDEPNVTSKKLDIDMINDRAPAVNRSLDLGPGSADIGRVQYRSVLKQDVVPERMQREIIAATENNPLMQSLQKNAEHDASLLAQLRQARPELFA
jgi:hypothetical protein